MRMLSYHDLVEKLKEGQKKLFEMKLQLSGQQLKNYMQIGQLRKEIARIQTIMAEKRSTGDLGAAAQPLKVVTHKEKDDKKEHDTKAKKAEKVKEHTKKEKVKSEKPKEKKEKKSKKAEKVVVKK